MCHGPIKDEIDLSCLTDALVPPAISNYLKLKYVPLRDSKNKTKRIILRKMQTMANLANDRTDDYGLPSIPTNTSEHITQGNETDLIIESV